MSIILKKSSLHKTSAQVKQKIVYFVQYVFIGLELWEYKNLKIPAHATDGHVYKKSYIDYIYMFLIKVN